MIASYIDTQPELNEILNKKFNRPLSFNLTGGQCLRIRSKHIPRLLHKELRKLRVGDHKFQGNAKNVLRRALLNHRNLIEIKFYNQLLPKLLGRMLLASNIAHGLTCLGLWRIRFSKESFSSLSRALCFTKTFSVADSGYLTFPND